MPIIITNQYLTSICELLTSLPLAGAASRARSKVLAMATLAAQDLAESELELAREHALCDETGTPEVDGDGHIRFATPEQAAAFIQARGVLRSPSGRSCLARRIPPWRAPCMRH